MTDLQHVTIIAAGFLITGGVFKAMSTGHWVDWTQKQNNIELKFACGIFGKVIGIYGLILLLALMFGEAWAVSIFLCYITWWSLFDRSI